VLNQKLRSSEAFFVFKMVGNDWLTRAQGVAGGRSQIGANTGMSDNAFFPSYSRTDEQPIFGGKVFQHFAVFGSEAEGRQARRVVKQVDEFRALKGQDPQLCKDFLLSNAQTE
jgi:hypothetical protein